MKRLEQLASRLLDDAVPAADLGDDVAELGRLLDTVRSEHDSGVSNPHAAGTLTDNGLALSPTLAAGCIEGRVRTVAFARGLHAAISRIHVWHPNRPARVLYAGCGPFALLAIPSMAVFSPIEATFTMIDLHDASIRSAAAVIRRLGLSTSVSGLINAEATRYEIDPKAPPDIILIETMQAGLEKEPQVAITRHLLAQAPEALLVPEAVNIDLVFADTSGLVGGRDIFSAPDLESSSRIRAGTVMRLDRRSVVGWQGIVGPKLPAATLRVPDDVRQRHQPMLFTSIDVFGRHRLGEAVDGLTAPRLLSADKAFRAGDQLVFQYRLGKHPRLVAAVEPL